METRISYRSMKLEADPNQWDELAVKRQYLERMKLAAARKAASIRLVQHRECDCCK